MHWNLSHNYVALRKPALRQACSERVEALTANGADKGVPWCFDKLSTNGADKGVPLYFDKLSTNRKG